MSPLPALCRGQATAALMSPSGASSSVGGLGGVVRSIAPRVNVHGKPSACRLAVPAVCRARLVAQSEGKA